MSKVSQPSGFSGRLDFFPSGDPRSGDPAIVSIKSIHTKLYKIRKTSTMEDTNTRTNIKDLLILIIALGLFLLAYIEMKACYG